MFHAAPFNFVFCQSLAHLGFSSVILILDSVRTYRSDCHLWFRPRSFLPLALPPLLLTSTASCILQQHAVSLAVPLCATSFSATYSYSTTTTHSGSNSTTTWSAIQPIPWNPSADPACLADTTAGSLSQSHAAFTLSSIRPSAGQLRPHLHLHPPALKAALGLEQLLGKGVELAQLQLHLQRAGIIVPHSDPWIGLIHLCWILAKSARASGLEEDLQLCLAGPLYCMSRSS